MSWSFRSHASCDRYTSVAAQGGIQYPRPMPEMPPGMPPMSGMPPWNATYARYAPRYAYPSTADDGSASRYGAASDDGSSERYATRTTTTERIADDAVCLLYIAF